MVITILTPTYNRGGVTNPMVFAAKANRKRF